MKVLVQELVQHFRVRVRERDRKSENEREVKRVNAPGGTWRSLERSVVDDERREEGADGRQDGEEETRPTLPAPAVFPLFGSVTVSPVVTINLMLTSDKTLLAGYPAAARHGRRRRARHFQTCSCPSCWMLLDEAHVHFKPTLIHSCDCLYLRRQDRDSATMYRHVKPR